ncbi:hypothetical protein ABGB12_08685 [Actinocorallia sp. B10E7]|uniref:hypothetical protein n=1 Tax=Actinocorallia sp. B10E7 TaxID=3153558 RepID=UPI00325C3D24
MPVTAIKNVVVVLLNVRVTATDLAGSLPSIAAVRRLSQSYAVLDAILSANGYVCYAFDRRWGPEEELASMTNGSGDEYSIVFARGGAFIRGFDHESLMSPYGDDGYDTWPGLIDSVPQEFAAYVTEPSFCDDVGLDHPILAATVCLWRSRDDTAWQTGTIEYPEVRDPDGAMWLFDLLAARTPEAYCAYASDYFGRTVDPADVVSVFDHQKLTPDLVRRLNPEIGLADLAAPLDTIGYGC